MVKARKVGKNRFDVITAERMWCFKHLDPLEMAEWISVINETI